MKTGPMTYAEYRRRRRPLARAGVVLVIAMMLTAGLAVGTALRGRVWTQMATNAGPPYRTSGYVGWGVSGTVVSRSISPINPITGEPFDSRRVDDTRVGFGWPLPALAFRIADLEKPPAYPARLFSACLDPRDLAYDTWLIGGIPAVRGQRTDPFPAVRHIPLTPRPLGFTINTLLAAIPLYLLLGGWSDLRSFLRSRKGRCPRCGYDARGLAACPECGLESPPASSRTQHTNICHLLFAICHLSPRQGSL